MNKKCPFIVELKYAFQTPDKLYFVVEYVNGGNRIPLPTQDNYSSIFGKNEGSLNREPATTPQRSYWLCKACIKITSYTEIWSRRTFYSICKDISKWLILASQKEQWVEERKLSHSAELQNTSLLKLSKALDTIKPWIGGVWELCFMKCWQAYLHSSRRIEKRCLIIFWA